MTEPDPFFEALRLHDEALRLEGKRAALDELLALADAFVLGNDSPFEKAWDVLNEKYSTTPPVRREIKPGSSWVGYKMNATVIDVAGNHVNYWHTHSDGTRSVYTTPEEFFRKNCTWVADPHEILPRSTWQSASGAIIYEVEVQYVDEFQVSYFPAEGGAKRNVPRTDWYARFIWVSDPPENNG